jgi:hypothetical protein
MTTFSETFSTVTAPGQTGAIAWKVKAKDSATYTAVGDVDALCEIFLERSTDRNNWRTVASWTGNGVSGTGTLAPDEDTYYRFRVGVTGLGSLTTFAVTFTDATSDPITVLRNSDGTACLTVRRDGIEAPKIYTDTVAESTSGAGVSADGVTLKDGGVLTNAGAAAAAVLLGMGSTASTGAQIKVIDETISFAGNAALYKAMTTPIPANSVVLAAQANIQAALTGGGTTTKVGLGPNATDPDKYGKTTVLTKNAKIDTIPAAWAVLASQEAIDVCSCANDGSAGNTALTVGSVRVRIVYLTLTSLANAA